MIPALVVVVGDLLSQHHQLRFTLGENPSTDPGTPLDRLELLFRKRPRLQEDVIRNAILLTLWSRAA